MLRRNLVLLVLAAVVLVVVLASALAWRQFDQDRRSALSEARARVVLAATIFDTYFSGSIATLTGIAQSRDLAAGNGPDMQLYFGRLVKANPDVFTGGISWIDSHGTLRASSAHPTSLGASVADRSYFTTVMKTAKPYVGEAVLSRIDGRAIIPIAVPTHALTGEATGVLVGSLWLRQRTSSAPGRSAVDLGYVGLAVLDRAGQDIVFPDLRRPRNTALARRLESPGAQVGAFQHIVGLDGARNHVVVYAPSPVAGWTVVIDRPAPVAFAAARRTLAIYAALIAAGSLIFLGLFGWVMVRARRLGEKARHDLRHWTGLTQDLAAATTGADVAQALAASLSSRFGDVDVVVALEAPDTHRLVSWTADDGLGLRPIDDLGNDVTSALARAHAAGERLRSFQPLAQRRNGEPVTALYAKPIITGSARPTGAVAILVSHGRRLTESDLAIVSWQASQAAQALDRTRNQETEHEVAMTLQRSLLPERLPWLDGVEIAGRYRPGSRGVQVGGDWYDVVVRDDGVLLVSVGDVAGHGIEAAAHMGNLRSAFRAYALEGLSPAGVIERLTRHTRGGNGLATVACLAIEPARGIVTYASAGHPPVVVVEGERGTRLLPATAPPLGYTGPLGGREVEVPVGPGAVLAVYTDGLVERRRFDITVEIDRLGATVEREAAHGADAIADAVLEELADLPRNVDDVALLVVKLAAVAPEGRSEGGVGHPGHSDGRRRVAG